ncbi:ABC-three component system protein [Alcaligenes aquatilis]|uniref:ABC-three component system protein n=1 Tax=Alcaligenes aquatilis TaxID=323284 RepID=UPI003D226288
MSIKQKTGRARPSNRLVAKGGVIEPSSQVLLFNPDQWEEFILAATRQRTLLSGAQYAFVKRLGGAGDGGRDVEARFVPDLKIDEWDLYQAKHYKSGLTKSDAYPEMAKFFKQLALKTYPRPKTYYICCPRAIGNELHNVMAAGAETFKAAFVTAWQNETHGMTGRAAELTPEVMAAINDFDFGRFVECQVNELLAWHKRDQAAHNELFGIVAERKDDDEVPATPTSHEGVYIEELMKVYTEHQQAPVTLSDIDIDTGTYAEHFMAQRQVFYCAEGLHRFSRDIYPDEPEFEKLLKMVHDGIRPTVTQLKLKSGMDRLDAAVDKASSLQVHESRLSPQLRGGDLPGTCHHLVNNGKLTWVKK